MWPPDGRVEDLVHVERPGDVSARVDIRGPIRITPGKGCNVTIAPNGSARCRIFRPRYSDDGGAIIYRERQASDIRSFCEDSLSTPDEKLRGPRYQQTPANDHS